MREGRAGEEGRNETLSTRPVLSFNRDRLRLHESHSERYDLMKDDGWRLPCRVAIEKVEACVEGKGSSTSPRRVLDSVSLEPRIKIKIARVKRPPSSFVWRVDRPC